jgi:sugar lactone lactonase YvrE
MWNRRNPDRARPAPQTSPLRAVIPVAITIAVTLATAAATIGCTREQPRVLRFVNTHRDTLTTTANIKLVGRSDGFYGPESVRYDPEYDLYYVSNMFGPGSAKDRMGYIARINAKDLSAIDVFIQSGKNGVVLNAPKGMAIQGDTLWVTDIDVVRGFSRKTGKPTRTIDLTPVHPQLLNDIGAAPDGTMYATDTGIIMSDKGVTHPGGDKVIEIRQDGAIRVRTNGLQLGWPNGVTWDAGRNRWVVVSFDPFHSVIYGLAPDGGAPDTIAKGRGRYDGIEILDDGSMLVTCWNDQSLHILTPDGQDRGLIGNLLSPADIGVDTRRNRVAIPLGTRGRVEVWQLPSDVRRQAFQATQPAPQPQPQP